MTNLARRTGAKQQTFNARNPRELLIKTVGEAKHSNREILLSDFKKRVKADETYFDAIVEYWFSNNMTAIGADDSFPANCNFTLKSRVRAARTGASESTPRSREEIIKEIESKREAGFAARTEAKERRIAAISKKAEDSKAGAIKLLRRYSSVVLMSMMTPVGKKLGDLTGTECAALGGWYETVGIMAGSNIISESLTENDLQAALDRS